jgi:predicted nucleotidyltransferase
MNLNFTDIKNVVASLKLNILFVGAGARILIFDTQYNVEGRATKDLDFAVQVNNPSNIFHSSGLFYNQHSVIIQHINANLSSPDWVIDILNYTV